MQEKNDIEDALTSRMETARRDMRTIFEQLNLLQQLEKIELDEDAKPILNFGLCAVVTNCRLSFYVSLFGL